MVLFISLFKCDICIYLDLWFCKLIPPNHLNNEWCCDERDDLWLMIDVINRFISFYFFIFKEKT